MSKYGFLASADPTALAAPGWPIAFAISEYVVVSLCFSVRKCRRTFFWNSDILSRSMRDSMFVDLFSQALITAFSVSDVQLDGVARNEIDVILSFFAISKLNGNVVMTISLL